MSGYKVFAVAGASGKVGKAILDELLRVQPELELEVRIITRKEGGNAAKDTDSLEKRGAKVYAVNYDERETIVHALEGVDVLISCFGATGFGLQLLLVKVAAIAQVKLYVNSHWGAPMDEYRYGLTHMSIKDEPIKLAQEVFHLPWTLFRVGIFPEFCIPFPVTELNLNSRKVVIYGDGQTPNSWTTIPDVARFAVYVLTHLSPSQLQNREFNIEGDRKTFNEVVQLYIAKHPGEFQVTYKPVNVLEEMVKKSEGKDFFHALMIEYATGRVAHDPTKLDNKEFPGWNPKQVVDTL
ncbi:NAD(P)-binding protein [Calocera viscosa TUFC12733]|uniref:NAD(P)-binding protein n=1 Tax=Calocera viscosa (strain TUFC12733) TaxID=1330018 RepID=A0A167KJJ7_CALVF|nr:NAD(P)-binding protein [Calocera viscosa TUFC12733]